MATLFYVFLLGEYVAPRDFCAQNSPADTAPSGRALFDQGSQGIQHAVRASSRRIGDFLDSAYALLNRFVRHGSGKARGEIFAQILL